MTDESGATFANIERPGEGVLGVLYWCSPEALDALDRYETGYDRTPVGVWDEAGETVDAVVYVARPEFRAGASPPSSEYVRRIVRGAREHGLPEHYIRSLQAAAGASDPSDV
ncbi:MAG TPA: gamma-glutamylcyclotransferase [Gemmata sp.]